MEKIKEFYSKIVGSTFIQNGQELLSALKEGDMLSLEPEPENPYDVNAIKVLNCEGKKLGFIPKETAKSLQKDIKAGYTIIVLVSEVTGGDKKNVGCNILVNVWEEIEDETYSEFLERKVKINK